MQVECPASYLLSHPYIVCSFSDSVNFLYNLKIDVETGKRLSETDEADPKHVIAKRRQKEAEARKNANVTSFDKAAASLPNIFSTDDHIAAGGSNVSNPFLTSEVVKKCNCIAYYHNFISDPLSYYYL